MSEENGKYEESHQNRYNIIGRLGEGVHGVVLKAIDLTNNQFVAIKKIPLKTKYGGISPYAVREIKILQHSDCENVSLFICSVKNCSKISKIVSKKLFGQEFYRFD